MSVWAGIHAAEDRAKERTALAEQNRLPVWSDCWDHDLPHRWKRVEVDPRAHPQTKEHAERDGWFVCVRSTCRAAGFGTAGQSPPRWNPGRVSLVR